MKNLLPGDPLTAKEKAIMNDELIPKAALILPPTGGDWYLATAEVARIPILLRNLAAAQRIGIERFYILISTDEKREVLQFLKNEKKFQGQLEWLDRDDPATDSVGLHDPSTGEKL
jgi:hypothetical protein